MRKLAFVLGCLAYPGLGRPAQDSSVISTSYRRLLGLLSGGASSTPLHHVFGRGPIDLLSTRNALAVALLACNTASGFQLSSCRGAVPRLAPTLSHRPVWLPRVRPVHMATEEAPSQNASNPRDEVMEDILAVNVRKKNPVSEDAEPMPTSEKERRDLKVHLFKMSASYDRGYGATPSARKATDDLVEELERLNPSEDAARGISGEGDSPLQGTWRMIWTTAPDVITLASSPIATVGAIYQVIDPPVATNVIDLIPRAQAFFPIQAQLSSILRAEVTTRTSPRQGRPNRIGLTFEAVKAKPVEALGMKVDFLPPLSIDLPRLEIPGGTEENSPGYFDVTYLDDDLLIYRQQAPGGYFALIKVDSSDP